jgi:hypothetical protein
MEGTVWRSLWWLVFPLIGIAACGTSAPTPVAGKPASITISLTTVPTVRSITISPDKAKFGNCSRGDAKDLTASTSAELGFPNGFCWVGTPGPPGSFPIKITNNGIASQIEVKGSNAVPSGGGNQWSLCNLGDQPAVACTGPDGSAPGEDQYLVENFSPHGRQNSAGLSGEPECDAVFASSGGCWAAQDESQIEGFKLIGPELSSNNSAKWTVTITWMPVPAD